MEEIKKLTEAGHFLSEGQQQTNQPSRPGSSPTRYLDADELQVLFEDIDGLKTPTSALKKIQPVFTCPPAPRKPEAAPLRKRKMSFRELRLLDVSTVVLSLYPPALLADFGNKLKKAGRDHQQQSKENIFIIKMIHDGAD